MTTSTEMTAHQPAEQKRASRASFVRGARRVGVIAVAAAMATPLALPAFASDSGSADGLQSIVAQDAQEVAGVVTAGESGLSDERMQVQATTPEQLAQIRAEIEAEAQRQEEARQAQAAQQSRSNTTTSRSNTGASNSGTSNSGTSNSGTSNSGTSNSGTSNSGSSSAATSGAASAGASGSTIANAALSQLGVAQDCVSLVRRSIAAAGLGYSGMGSLFNLGPTISMSQASPGDVIYYANGGTGRAHIAIYIGGGRAVHGGWSGYYTVIAGVNIGGSAPVFIDIT